MEKRGNTEIIITAAFIGFVGGGMLVAGWLSTDQDKLEEEIYRIKEQHRDCANKGDYPTQRDIIWNREL